MSRKSKDSGPRFVEPARKGKFYFVIFFLLIACAVLGYLFYETRNENLDLKKELKSATTITTTTKPKSTTTTTVPEKLVANIDIIARNNDSNRTTERIRTDFPDQVEVTQVSSYNAISETVVVVNNPTFEDLANEIVEALSSSVGMIPEGQKASVADIVIYVKS